jgi:hypothetical protein
MQESDDLRDGFAWLVALWKFQEVARHANGIYTSQFGVRNNFKMSQINQKRKLVIIIISATALMYYTIFANNNGNKKETTFMAKIMVT